MRLSRLKINRFRNVRPGTELVFGEGYNVVLGRNGSGKTTLLDLFSVVTSGDFTPLEGEEASLEYALELEQCALEVSFENKLAPRETNGLRFRLSPNNEWELSVQLSTSATASRFTLTPENTTLHKEGKSQNFRRVVSPFQGSSLYFGLAPLLESPEHLRTVALLNPGNSRFDESLGIFDKITTNAVLAAWLGIFVRKGFEELLPLDLEETSPPPPNEPLSISAKNLRFLDSATSLMGYSDASLSRPRTVKSAWTWFEQSRPSSLKKRLDLCSFTTMGTASGANARPAKTRGSLKT